MLNDNLNFLLAQHQMFSLSEKPAQAKDQPRRQAISATRKKKKKDFLTYVPTSVQTSKMAVVELNQEHPVRVAPSQNCPAPKFIDPPKLLQTRQSIENEYFIRNSEPLLQKPENEVHLQTLMQKPKLEAIGRLPSLSRINEGKRGSSVAPSMRIQQSVTQELQAC